MLTFAAFDETEFGRSPALFRKKEDLMALPQHKSEGQVSAS
jgi:hypothetical protein